MQVDVLRLEFIEIFKAAVVGVDHLGSHVSRTRGAIEGHHHAGIIIEGVAVDVLAGWAAHELLAGLIPGFHLDRSGPVQQHAVGNDFGIETRGAELLCDILGGFVILGRGGHMRSRGERF